MLEKFNKVLPAKWRRNETIIPVVRLQGAIMASGGGPFRQSLNLASVAPLLERAFKSKASPAVAISINSPGGSPVQSRQIYQRIRQLAVEHDKKVHVFVDDVAASGGYMIAIAGDDITVDPSSIIGSIGVVAATFGFTELMEKVGIQRRVYTAGKNKVTLDPFQPENKKDIEHLKMLQLDIHEIFIDMVKQSRGDKLSDDADLFTGLFWTGQRAVDLGLVDGIGDIRSSIKAKYGETAKLKLLQPKRGLFGRAAAGGINAEFVGAAADQLLSVAEEKALWARYGL